jgi:phosphoribosylformylglycinamidine synthase
MMLSESQERMLMVLKPGAEPQAERIFRKWDLDFAVIGEVTDTGRLHLTFHGETVGDLPLAPIGDDAPKYDRPWVPTPAAEPLPEALATAGGGLDDFTRLIGHPNLASRRWIWEQYDHMVGANTIQRPGGDAAVVRVHGTAKGLAMTTDCTPRYCLADPVMGGRQAIAEAYRNLSAVGAKPLAVTDCMNFAAPTRPEVMGQFVGAIEGMADACRTLDFPVVSGNCSLYNETEGRGIMPTPAIGAVGLLENWENSATIGLKPGQRLWMLGEHRGHLGCSLFARALHGDTRGAPPPVDLASERATGEYVRALIAAGRVSAVHDVSDGGLLVAAFEMAAAGDCGVSLQPDAALGFNAWAYGEDQGRYLVCAGASETFADCPVPATLLGETGGDRFAVADAWETDIASLRRQNEAYLPELMAR